MSLPGRNAPCPCGSGRKYKHCCMRTAVASRVEYSSQERQNAFAKLLRFAQREEFDERMRLGRSLFWGGRLDLTAAERRRTLEADKESTAAFLTWLVFDFSLEDYGGTIADDFLAARGDTLSSGERTYLDRMRASCLRLYEVIEVRPDEGLGLRDLWTDEVVEVRERLATRQLARWDLFATRVIQGPEGWLVLDGIPHLLPSSGRESALGELRRHLARLKREVGTDDPNLLFKRVGMLFHHLWLDHVALRPMPKVVTAEGDPLTFARTFFDITDHERVAMALGSHSALERDDDDGYVWLERTPSFNRSLGRVSLAGKRLTLETTSEARAERGRRFLQELLGDAIRFRATVLEGVEQALERAPKRPEKAVTGVPPELEREVVTQLYTEHYRSWLDQPIPALGDRTPRKAAELKTVRPKLVDLLKELENGMEREERSGRPIVDLTFLWEELGIGRP